jgi:hypothetical protein
VRAHSTSASVTRTLAGAVFLCFSSQVPGQGAAQTQPYIIHGTPKTCSAITQLDNALLTDSQQFFAGWTEKDYADAVAWSQACSENGGSEYGWHIPGHRRIALLQVQHDAALGSAQTQSVSSAAPAQAVSSPSVGSALPSPPIEVAAVAPAQAVPSAPVGSALPSPPVQVAAAAPAQAVSSAAVGSALPGPPVQAAVAARAQAVPSAAVGSALPSPPVQVAAAAPAQAVSSAAVGSALPSPRARARTAPDVEEDSLLTDSFFKEHFHQESLWVANKANLDVGDDRGPSNWSNNGMQSQMRNRLTADRIVLYCARKTNSGEPGKRPLLWDLRWCEAEEASAYSRLVSANEFPTAGRGIVLGCAGVDSYIYLERCMETLTSDGGKH